MKSSPRLRWLLLHPTALWYINRNSTSMDLFLLPCGSSSRGSQQCCSVPQPKWKGIYLIILPQCLLPKCIPHFPSEEQSSAQLLPLPSTAPKHPAGLKQLLRSHSQKQSPGRCFGNHRQVAVSEVLTSYKHIKGVPTWQASPLAPSFRIHGQDEHGAPKLQLHS